MAPSSAGDRGRTADPVVPVELRRFQKRLLRAVTTSARKEDLLVALGGLVHEAINVTVARYYRRDEDRLVSTWQRVHGSGTRFTEPVQQQLLDCCDVACGKGQLQVDRLAEAPGLVAFSVPVFLKQQAPDALLFTVPETTRRLERAVVMFQLVASHVTLWHTLQETQDATREAQAVAALLEMIDTLAGCSDVRHGCYLLACELKEYLGWDHVAVGLCRGRRRACCLRAISGRAEFDKNSERTRAIEAAMDEAVLRGTVAQCPSKDDASQLASRALSHLKACTGSRLVVSGPLRDGQEGATGAWIFLADERDTPRTAEVRFLRAAEHPVASCLQLLQRAESGVLGRLGQRAVDGRKGWRTKASLAATCLVVAVLAIPLPYKIKADCQVQPYVHRFVAAPYDGRLEKADVGPGDVVAKGDVLAHMDGRDIRWELASLIAEHGRAAKRRDVALASHDVVTAQLAKLEMKKLDLNMKMLDDRAAHLEIKSPIDGIVIGGDLERAEGAPLSSGQSLFEIAPLDQAIIEIAVPEDEIRFVTERLDTTIRLEAYPRRTWLGAIANVQPRSENKDDQNVFIAEVRLDNPDDSLRPGMNGRVEIVAGRHALVWNLLHKPCELLLSWLGW
ncbi:MAG: efflux RND transporter periplasmic adaptor subunit [Pirellulales bacterium]